jgi:uncharacterized protein YbbC (DUF1343 family)
MQNLQHQEQQRFLRLSFVLSWRKFFAAGRRVSLKGAGAARKVRVYASHPFGTFHVDARIPRLYITHGRMPHNESSSTMFRISFALMLLVFAGVIGVSVVALRLLSRDSVPQASPAPSSPAQAAEHTQTGIDVLEEQNFAPLRGKRVGLITNQTGVDSRGRRIIDVLAHAEGVKLVALFSPEHGIAGQLDTTNVANATDAATGLKIFSLYGDTRRPTDQMLQGLDALVFDIQGAGVRFYTFITTMGYCMEAAAKHKITFFVLDRPDPLGGEKIQGPMLDPSRISFVGYFRLPVIYGMTFGELAQMFNTENKMALDLHVVAMKNWRRSETFDQTGLTWIPPSPNLRTLKGALLYPGIEILQPAGISVGRGTSAPFERLGAPWVHSDVLLNSLNAKQIPGVRFTAASFTPSDGLYKGEACAGVNLEITDGAAFDSIRTGLEIADSLHRGYPERFEVTKLMDLLASQTTVNALIAYQPPADIIASWADDLAQFRTLRAKYLLYN